MKLAIISMAEEWAGTAPGAGHVNKTLQLHVCFGLRLICNLAGTHNH
jgi:hypothetical protein